MSSFVPAGNSDFESDDEYQISEPGIYETNSNRVKFPSTQIDVDNSKVSTTTTLRIPIDKNNTLRTAIIYGDKINFEKILMKLHSPDMLLRCDWTPLMYSCYFAKHDIVNICIKLGADVNYAIQDGATPLLKACQSPKNEADVMKCVHALVEKDASLLKTDEKQKSCLIIAAREGKLDLLKLLLKLALNKVKMDLINLQDCSGWNALDWAVAKQHFDCATELVGQGAVPSPSRSNLSLPSEIKTVGEDANNLVLNVWANKNSEKASESETENMKDINPEKYEHGKIEQNLDPNKDLLTSNLPHTPVNDAPGGDFSTVKSSENVNEKSNIFEDTTNEIIVQEDEYIQTQPIFKDVVPNHADENYVEYGQLELFLHGLDLSHITPIFQAQDIRFEQLLCLTMKDLETIGIKQLGVRKRILSAVHQCNTEQWTNASMPDFTERAMSVDDITQVLANLEEHTRYMASSIRFIESKINEFPEILQTPACEQVKKPVRHELLEKVHDLIPSLHKLCRAAKNLDVCLMNKKSSDSVDYIPPQNLSKKRSFVSKSINIIALVSIGCFVFYKFKAA